MYKLKFCLLSSDNLQLYVCPSFWFQSFAYECCHLIFYNLPQEVVDDKGFIAVPNSIEVHIEVIKAEEEQAQPRGQGVHRNNEQDTDYPALLSRVRVISKKNIIQRYLFPIQSKY